MSTFQKILLGVVTLAVVVMGYFMFAPHKSTLGDATVSNYPTWYYGGIVIGPANNLLNQEINGTATCAFGPVTLAPTVTGLYDCAVSNVQLGDRVFVTLASTTPGDLRLAYAFASSTSGYVTLGIRNASSTGAAQAVAGATSSVQYLIVR